MPDFECFKYHKQFFVVDVVFELRRGKSLRVKSNQMNFTVGWRYGGKDSSEGVVRGIRFNDKWRAWNPVSQDWRGGEGLF